MKKLLFLPLLLLAVSCEQEYNTILETAESSLRVTSINRLGTVLHTAEDSTIEVSIGLENTGQVTKVAGEIYSPDGDLIGGAPLQLYDNGNSANGDLQQGDGIFTNTIIMSRLYPNGNYYIHYYVSDAVKGTFKAGSQTFSFDNGQTNIPPVISNLRAPDTLNIPEPDTVAFQMTLAVSDSNGLQDIEEVFFYTIRPDGTKNTFKFFLYDDGAAESGDETANDGIYSIIVQVNYTNTKGLYQFEFHAKDRRKQTSNIILHPILIL